MDEEYTEELEHLRKRIYTCNCKAVTEGYCSHCECKVLDFMIKYGFGTLIQFVKVERLEKELSELKQINKNINELSVERLHRIIKLKDKLKDD